MRRRYRDVPVSGLLLRRRTPPPVRLHRLYPSVLLALAGCTTVLPYRPGEVRPLEVPSGGGCAGARLTQAQSLDVYGRVQTHVRVTFGELGGGAPPPDSITVRYASFTAPTLRFAEAEVRVRSTASANYTWTRALAGTPTALPRGDALVVAPSVTREGVGEGTTPRDLAGLPIGFVLGWSQGGLECSASTQLTPVR